MKRFLIIAFVVLGMVLSGAAFAQTMAPATPIGPEAPSAPPPTVSPAAPVAPPAPAPVPVKPLAFKDFWASMSIDVGTPFTGLTQENKWVGIDGSQLFFVDGIMNFTLGFTPLHATPDIAFGGIVRGSGTVDLGSDTEYSYFVGDWFSISPMAAARFRLGNNSYVDLGAGISYYSYINMTQTWYDDDGYAYLNTTSSIYDPGHTTSSIYDPGQPTYKGTSGVALAALLELVEGGLTAEIGLTGPDVYAGCGFAF